MRLRAQEIKNEENRRFSTIPYPLPLFPISFVSGLKAEARNLCFQYSPSPKSDGVKDQNQSEHEHKAHKSKQFEDDRRAALSAHGKYD